MGSWLVISMSDSELFCESAAHMAGTVLTSCSTFARKFSLLSGFSTIGEGPDLNQMPGMAIFLVQTNKYQETVYLTPFAGVLLKTCFHTLPTEILFQQIWGGAQKVTCGYTSINSGLKYYCRILWGDLLIIQHPLRYWCWPRINKYLLSIYYMPGTFIHIGNIIVNKVLFLLPASFQCNGRGQQVKWYLLRTQHVGPSTNNTLFLSFLSS